MMAKKKIVKRSAADPRISQGRVSQSEFPSTTLDSAVRVADALYADFGGRGGAPHDVALAMGVSPTSSAWRVLCGASIAYGLTEGGYAADTIKLTPLGRRVVAPESEGDSDRARVEALLKPKVVRLFFEKYDRAKFPQDVIAQNVLVSLGFPRERSADGVEILKQSGRSVGIIRETKTGPFVAIGVPEHRQDRIEVSTTEGGSAEAGEAPEISPLFNAADSSTAQSKANTRVFISHGKNRAVVDQIRELLIFGGFEPVVSVDQERTAIPVPEKVFHDMRACGAGVIHVSSEGDLLSPDGIPRILINQNVLIEIGGALALYGKRVVLLVERGLTLPSNLQGLYRCEYTGDKLDYEATMKLLKTFNQFKE